MQGDTHTQRGRRTSVCAGGARLSHTHSHAATTAAAHATTRSKRGEVVWETAVLLSLSPVVVTSFIVSVLAGVSFVLLCFTSPSSPSSPSSLPVASDSGAFLGIATAPPF
ncbi:hypothetical protein TCDM_13588 [Trypanosoma cruzi Dm28c]|uniref:Uncharacterized protein n=1 Tax=Trypanosoma cruzi Dm28c TaxID=1416333 RepID=V5AI97_TRYCR|nr:hypothetical protein TCDM_13588 [Trypanosoma cruzi Dm28c]